VRDLIEQEAKEVLLRLSESAGNEASFNYYQGKIDTLSWVLKQLPEEG
jgi:hypothetical protein